MKRLGAIISILVSFVIGISLMESIPNLMNAANDDNPWGEPIVDFIYGQSPSARMYVYAVGTEGHLFINNNNVTTGFIAARESMVLPGEGTENGELLDNIIQVSTDATANTEHNVMALRSDGSIYMWGHNDKGQFGNGTTSEGYISTPTIIKPSLSGKIIAVESLFNANYILMENGDVYASGEAVMLGSNSQVDSNVFTKVNISNVKKITGSANTMYALKNDGTVYTWGKKVYDGKNKQENVAEPIAVYGKDGSVFNNIIDISCEGSAIPTYNTASVSLIEIKENIANGYQVGFISQHYPNDEAIELQLSVPIQSDSEVKNVTYGYMDNETLGFVVDGAFYTEASKPLVTPATKVVKGGKQDWFNCILSESGALYLGGAKQNMTLGFDVSAKKTDNSKYEDEEKYNNDVVIQAVSNNQITCQVEDPVGAAAVSCNDYIADKINVSANQDRIYRKYLFNNTVATKEIIIDLYKNTPELKGYSDSSVNKIQITDSILIQVPSDQASWNTYSATITDSSGNTTNFTGGTLSVGTYTLHLKDSYGNTQNYQFEVSDSPEPAANFTPANTSLTYGDNATKANNTIGTFSLTYPAGEPTSNIKTIQLGTSGDESHFSVDTTGALKVKGTDLDAGTYSVTVSGTDGNDMPFTKTVSITVAKKNQDNYQITNQANYPFQLNQEINITTTGNDSGENETYTITNGNSVAQIVGNKFKLLSAGTFTLQATVGGNTNYNSKTVTKQITVSQLPTQNPPVSITSKDSIMYGETYTPTYSGGQGSGAVSWTIENDNGTGAALSNGKITVTGVGTFTIKVTKAGTSSYQASTATKVITVNKRKTIVKPKNVTKTVGQVFKDNGATYTPQPIAGDNIGTLVITSKYPNNQAPGQYTDGIQASGLSNPNYEFEYQEGTLIINSNSLPNNGEGYYKVTGTKGKNNWYISDVQISTTNKNGYDEISNDGINFQTTPLVYSTDGDYPTDFYLRNSSTGLIAKAIRYQLKIDQTPPDVPTLSMKEINKSAIARFINALSFGNWMNQAAEVTMTSSDATSGLDYYEYTETSKSGTNTKQSTNGIVTYQNDVELTLQAKACDKAGNCSDLSSDEGIMIDRKAPTITGVKDKSEYKFYYLPRFVKVTDDYSGLSYSEYKLDGAMAGTIQNNVDERISSVGEYEVYAIDNAGNDITITFKIVPLPDIETEIDGSDESKDIIDQVIDELDEIKDKIDETEKKDIEDWIKDALDKWNSLRKKVVETDDKSAKVEGQGDTTFDPSVVLVVDDIGENDVPPLPKKAIAIYDVYLQKGNVRIQPDGKIKVYLPYAAPTNVGYAMGGAVAQPIIYQIDEKDKISELKCNLEGSFVTFITDELLRYAISDENQKCPLDGIEINIDSDGDGKPDVNIDIDGDCKADLNIDTDGDGQPNINIDTDLDGKPDYNIDTDGDGKPDVNIGPVNEPFEPTVCKTVNGMEYCSDPYKKPYLNIDSDGDGRPDINVDLDGDMEADINIDIDGDNIPDLNIDSDGDGVPDINIDTDNDGKADKNILKLTEWKPDKNVDGSIKYDTMSGLLSLLNDKDDDISKPSKPMGGALTGSDTSDSSTPFLWWILVLINIITMFWCYVRVRKEKEQSYER